MIVNWAHRRRIIMNFSAVFRTFFFFNKPTHIRNAYAICSLFTEWLLFYQKCSFFHEFWSRSQNEIVINHQAIFLKHMLNENKNACSATIFNSKMILNAGETNLQMIRLMHRQTDTQMNRWMKNLCVNRLFSWIHGIVWATLSFLCSITRISQYFIHHRLLKCVQCAADFKFRFQKFSIHNYFTIFIELILFAQSNKFTLI